MWRFGVWNKKCFPSRTLDSARDGKHKLSIPPPLHCSPSAFWSFVLRRPATPFGGRWDSSASVPSAVFTTHLFTRWFTSELTATKGGGIPSAQGWVRARRSVWLNDSSHFSLSSGDEKHRFPSFVITMKGKVMGKRHWTETEGEVRTKRKFWQG